MAPGFAADLVRVLRAHRQRDPDLSELRARLVGDRITAAYLARELPGGQQLDPAELAAEVGTTATVARQWLHTLRAGQQGDRRLASLRVEPVSHGRPTTEQLHALQAAYADGGRPQPDSRPAGRPLERIEQLYRDREITGGRPLDPAEVARQVGVSEHYVRGTLGALRGGKLTSAERIEQLWRLWEVQGGQRLAFADVARLVGVREGRVRQVLGPLRTAHRHATEAERAGQPVAVIEDGGRQAWLDQAACRDLDPERFFPEPGEQTKAAEAKAICSGCQVRDHCRDLAVNAAGGIDADHGIFGGTLPTERSRLRGNTFPEPSAYRQRRDLAEAAHTLANQVGLRQAAKQLGIHRDALKAAFTQWGLPMPERRVGWQPSRFLADRAEAERAFALAEQLGSVNAAASELGTTWPSLRKAFTRHGLGMPTRNPEAVRQRAIAAARQRSGQPATPTAGPGVCRPQPRRSPGAAAVAGRAVPVGPPRRGVRHPGRQRGRRAEQRKPRPPAHHPRLGDHPPRRTRPPPPQRPSRPWRAPAGRPCHPQRPHQPIPPTPGAGDGSRCPLIPPRRRALDAGGQLVTHPYQRSTPKPVPPGSHPRPAETTYRWCPVSRDLVHVSLELDQSTRVSHIIWSARRRGPLGRLT